MTITIITTSFNLLWSPSLDHSNVFLGNSLEAVRFIFYRPHPSCNLTTNIKSNKENYASQCNIVTCIFRSLSCSSATLSSSTIVFSSANVEFMLCTMLLYTPSMSDRLIFVLCCTKIVEINRIIPC